MCVGECSCCLVDLGLVGILTPIARPYRYCRQISWLLAERARNPLATAPSDYLNLLSLLLKVNSYSRNSNGKSAKVSTRMLVAFFRPIQDLVSFARYFVSLSLTKYLSDPTRARCRPRSALASRGFPTARFKSCLSTQKIVGKRYSCLPRYFVTDTRLELVTSTMSM